ncbi:MAG: glucose-6-phosphate isomerase [Chloroflexi bacterium]|nr:glucose-6-phosphate isomerase [Chloroflexota bacterium]
MRYTRAQLWERFQKYYTEFPSLGLAMDLSRMNFADDFFDGMAPRMQKALQAMAALEKGAMANLDEQRMVGHYWLRDPDLAPTPELQHAIKSTLLAVESFARDVHAGTIKGAKGSFKNLLLIGIGGSALGPQFVAHALGHPKTDKMFPFFFDNTDPDGMQKVLSQLETELGRTLCLVISKSGGTKETRNGMLEAKAAYESVGLQFESHAVAITKANSELDKLALANQWLRIFPMWDWVGGRTSVTSAVGLLPAALQGIDILALLDGACACDAITRMHSVKENPAAQLSLMWFYAGNGKGAKNMVILPYKDQLVIFSRYLQQLVMESLGKEVSLDSQIVNQGITVFGNKGSTDQHAYIQQLRDGPNDFFVTFIEVLKDGSGRSVEVEPNVTSGDFLHGLLLGTRQALYERERESITLVLNEVSPFAVGVLIALYERAVGFYASLVNINAYHQPGVEAGKKAAGTVLDLQLRIATRLGEQRGYPLTLAELADGIGAPEDQENVFHVCEHLAANPNRGISKIQGQTPFAAKYVRV